MDKNRADSDESMTTLNTVKAWRQILKSCRDIEKILGSDDDELKTLPKKIVSDIYLQHRDGNVRLIVACCIADLFRLTYPDLPYDKHLRAIFRLFKQQVLRIRSKDKEVYKPCYYLLKVLSENRIFESFDRLGGYAEELRHLIKSTFSVISCDHNYEVKTRLCQIVIGLMNEKDCSDSDTVCNLLSNLLHDNEQNYGDKTAVCFVCMIKVDPEAATELASMIVRKTSNVVERYLSSRFTLLVEGAPSKGRTRELKIFYCQIFELYKIIPDSLLYVLCYVQNLLDVKKNRDVEIVKITTELLGKLFVVGGIKLATEYSKLWNLFLDRCKDDNKYIQTLCVKICEEIVFNHSELLNSNIGPVKLCDVLVEMCHSKWQVVQLAAIQCIGSAAVANMNSVTFRLLACVWKLSNSKKSQLQQTVHDVMARVYAEHFNPDVGPGTRLTKELYRMFCELRHCLIMSAVNSTSAEQRLHTEKLVYAHVLHTDLDARSRVTHLLHVHHDAEKYAPGCMNKFLMLLPNLRSKLSSFLNEANSSENEDHAQLDYAFTDLSNHFTDEILPFGSLYTLQQAVNDDSELMSGLRKISQCHQIEKQEWKNCVMLVKRSVKALKAQGLVTMVESLTREPVNGECVQILVQMLCEYHQLRGDSSTNNACIDRQLVLSGHSLLVMLAREYRSYFNDESVWEGLLALLNILHDANHHETCVCSVLETFLELGITSFKNSSDQIKMQMETAILTLIDSDSSKISKLAIGYLSLIKLNEIPQLLTERLDTLATLKPRDERLPQSLVVIGELIRHSTDRNFSHLQRVQSDVMSWIVDELLGSDLRNKKDSHCSTDEDFCQVDLDDQTYGDKLKGFCVSGAVNPKIRRPSDDPNESIVATGAEEANNMVDGKCLQFFFSVLKFLLTHLVRFMSKTPTLPQRQLFGGDNNAALRLTSGLSLLKIVQNSPTAYHNGSSALLHVAHLIRDECRPVRKGIAAELVTGLTKFTLPISYLAVLVLGATPENKDQEYSAQIRQIVKVWRKAVSVVPESRERAFIPDYALPHAVFLLARHLTNEKHEQDLWTVYVCLKEMLEALYEDNIWCTTVFYTETLQALRNSTIKNGSKAENKKLHAVCEIGLHVITLNPMTEQCDDLRPILIPSDLFIKQITLQEGRATEYRLPAKFLSLLPAKKQKLTSLQRCNISQATGSSASMFNDDDDNDDVLCNDENVFDSDDAVDTSEQNDASRVTSQKAQSTAKHHLQDKTNVKKDAKKNLHNRNLIENKSKEQNCSGMDAKHAVSKKKTAEFKPVTNVERADNNVEYDEAIIPEINLTSDEPMLERIKSKSKNAATQSTATVNKSEAMQSEATLNKNESTQSKTTVSKSEATQSKVTVNKSEATQNKATLNKNESTHSKATVSKNEAKNSRETVSNDKKIIKQTDLDSAACKAFDFNIDEENENKLTSHENSDKHRQEKGKKKETIGSKVSKDNLKVKENQHSTISRPERIGKWDDVLDVEPSSDEDESVKSRKMKDKKTTAKSDAAGNSVVILKDTGKDVGDKHVEGRKPLNDQQNKAARKDLDKLGLSEEKSHKMSEVKTATSSNNDLIKSNVHHDDGDKIELGSREKHPAAVRPDVMGDSSNKTKEMKIITRIDERENERSETKRVLRQSNHSTVDSELSLGARKKVRTSVNGLPLVFDGTCSGSLLPDKEFRERNSSRIDQSEQENIDLFESFGRRNSTQERYDKVNDWLNHDYSMQLLHRIASFDARDNANNSNNLIRSDSMEWGVDDDVFDVIEEEEEYLDDLNMERDFVVDQEEKEEFVADQEKLEDLEDQVSRKDLKSMLKENQDVLLDTESRKLKKSKDKLFDSEDMNANTSKNLLSKDKEGIFVQDTQQIPGVPLSTQDPDTYLDCSNLDVENLAVPSSLDCENMDKTRPVSGCEKTSFVEISEKRREKPSRTDSNVDRDDLSVDEASVFNNKNNKDQNNNHGSQDSNNANEEKIVNISMRLIEEFERCGKEHKKQVDRKLIDCNVDSFTSFNQSKDFDSEVEKESNSGLDRNDTEFSQVIECDKEQKKCDDTDVNSTALVGNTEKDSKTGIDSNAGIDGKAGIEAGIDSKDKSKIKIKNVKKEREKEDCEGSNKERMVENENVITELDQSSTENLGHEKTNFDLEYVSVGIPEEKLRESNTGSRKTRQAALKEKSANQNENIAKVETAAEIQAAKSTDMQHVEVDDLELQEEKIIPDSQESQDDNNDEEILSVSQICPVKDKVRSSVVVLSINIGVDADRSREHASMTNDVRNTSMRHSDSNSLAYFDEFDKMPDRDEDDETVLEKFLDKNKKEKVESQENLHSICQKESSISDRNDSVNNLCEPKGRCKVSVPEMSAECYNQHYEDVNALNTDRQHERESHEPDTILDSPLMASDRMASPSENKVQIEGSNKRKYRSSVANIQIFRLESSQEQALSESLKSPPSKVASCLGTTSDKLSRQVSELPRVSVTASPLKMDQKSANSSLSVRSDSNHPGEAKAENSITKDSNTTSVSEQCYDTTIVGNNEQSVSYRKCSVPTSIMNVDNCVEREEIRNREERNEPISVPSDMHGRSKNSIESSGGSDTLHINDPGVRMRTSVPSTTLTFDESTKTSTLPENNSVMSKTSDVIGRRTRNKRNYKSSVASIQVFDLGSSEDARRTESLTSPPPKLSSFSSKTSDRSSKLTESVYSHSHHIVNVRSERNTAVKDGRQEITKDINTNVEGGLPRPDLSKSMIRNQESSVSYQKCSTACNIITSKSGKGAEDDVKGSDSGIQNHEDSSSKASVPIKKVVLGSAVESGVEVVKKVLDANRCSIPISNLSVEADKCDDNNAHRSCEIKSSDINSESSVAGRLRSTKTSDMASEAVQDNRKISNKNGNVSNSGHRISRTSEAVSTINVGSKVDTDRAVNEISSRTTNKNPNTKSSVAAVAINCNNDRNEEISRSSTTKEPQANMVENTKSACIGETSCRQSAAAIKNDTPAAAAASGSATAENCTAATANKSAATTVGNSAAATANKYAAATGNKNTAATANKNAAVTADKSVAAIAENASVPVARGYKDHTAGTKTSTSIEPIRVKPLPSSEVRTKEKCGADSKNRKPDESKRSKVSVASVCVTSQKSDEN